jgi:site-specific recombinase XerD
MKELLGHASLATTSTYVTTEQRQRMAAVQKFARRRQVP